MMSVSRVAVCISLLMAALALPLEAAAPTLKKAPVLRIPRLAQAPTIDGRINEAAWNGAAIVSGFSDFKNKLMVPADLQPAWWIGYDNDNLYFAQRYVLYPKGTILAKLKRGDEGGANVEAQDILFEDHVEIQIADTHERHKPNRTHFYKLSINPYGAVCDQRIEPAVGWLGYEWESGAAVKCTVTDTAWFLEMALPWKSLKRQGPPEDGTRWLMQLVSSSTPETIYFAWQPTSWMDWDTLPEVIFDSTAPAVQLADFGQPMDGRMDLRWKLTAAAAAANVKVNVQVEDINGKSLYQQEQQVQLQPGQNRELAFAQRLELADNQVKWGNIVSYPETYRLKLHAATDDDRVLYDHEILMVKTPPDIQHRLYEPLSAGRAAGGNPNLTTTYYHSYKKLAATADTAVLNASPALRAARNFTAGVARKGESKPLMKADGRIGDDGQGRLVVDLPALTKGDYEAFVAIQGSGGEELAAKRDPFTVRKYEWEGSKAGTERIIPAPFEQVRVEESTLHVWGRSIRFGDQGLPQSLVSKGQDILAGPMHIEAEVDGAAQSWSGKSASWTQTDSDRATWTAQGRWGALGAVVRAATDYDGSTLYTLTLKPEGGQSVKVGRLDLVIPLKGLEQYLMFRSERIRNFGTAPRKDGVFWDSSRLPNAPFLHGTFLPFCMMTDGERGLTWVADSDRGWLLDDAKPAFLLERQGDSVVMRVRFCNTERSFSQPRTIEFMLQATPEKPYPADYRYRMWQTGNAPHDQYGSCTWGFGSGPTNVFHAPEHYDAMRSEILKLRRGISMAADRLAVSGPRFETLVRFYNVTNMMGLAMPEYDTYGGEWVGTTYVAPRPFAEYSGMTNAWGTYDNPRECTRMFADLTPSVVDARVWAFDRQQQLCGLNGYWWDLELFWSTGDPIKGSAYIRDDGKPQAVFNILAMREMMKRMAVCAQLNGVRPFHGYYPSGLTPITAFQQYIWAVEGPYFLNSENNDLLDNFDGDLNNFRVALCRNSGNPIFLTALVQDMEKTDPRQSRNVLGMSLLMDVGVNGVNHLARQNIIAALDRFRFFNAGNEWVPWWRSQSLVRLSGADSVVATAYRRTGEKQGGAMVVLFNSSREDRSVAITADGAALKLGKVVWRDLENPQASVDAGKVTVRGRDFRLLAADAGY